MIKKIAEIRIKTTRGQGLFNEIKNALLISASIKVMLELTIFLSAILCLLVLIGFYIVGYIDLKYFKLYQTEALLNSSKYNPQLKKIDRIVRNAS